MPRDYLIDVSRLVWRCWTQRLPTGIDRVCLAYLVHYGDRALAVVQRGGRQLVLSATASDRLFALLGAGRGATRTRLALVMGSAMVGARRIPPRPGMLYLNVGHTGLNEPSLPQWVAAHRSRAIYLVHDLIPLTHPEFCRAAEPAKHEQRMANVLASAAGVIGNSRATLADLAAFASQRGVPMPPAVAAWISGPSRRTASVEPPLDTPYFVTLGTIEGRKNHLLLLEIWREMVAELGAAAPTLVVIGQRGWEAGPALALLEQPAAFGGKVIELNHCSDEQLAGWLSAARALLMPSFTEGFGLPIIEALQQGTPVIASDLPVFREIAPSIPCFIEPDDRATWALTIRQFVGDDPERARQLDRMSAYIPPTWSKHFAIVDDWLDSL